MISQQPTRLPDLPDMLDAGLGITEALAFWNEMMNSPERDSKDWWAVLNDYRRQFGRTLQ